ncbi:MAG TPA: succinylglutamate desuccinylase/aspartoacylase family protein [Candidatus Cybelea sp.]|nr:succinylglutamate desuccinylase/aspartoacylase family protein [Candidatus Cybelea sp.]
MISPGGTYPELVERWESLQSSGIRLHRIVCEPSDRTLLCADLGDPRLPSVAIAAGVHGDEPAGAWALLHLAERNELPPEFSYRIWPCTNPSGFAARTRQNADGIDVNRTFGGDGASPEATAIVATNRGSRFSLSIDLHEDCDAAGFYCYEYGGGDFGQRVVAALAANGFPIDPLEATFDLAGPLDDANCSREPGRVVADAAREAVALGGLSYSLALARSGVRRVLTFETPSAAAWEARVAMHVTAVSCALDALLEESAHAKRK